MHETVLARGSTPKRHLELALTASEISFGFFIFIWCLLFRAPMLVPYSAIYIGLKVKYGLIPKVPFTIE